MNLGRDASVGARRRETLIGAGGCCIDQEQLRADVAEFFRGLRRELSAAPLPYAWAPELASTRPRIVHLKLIGAERRRSSGR